MNQKKTGWQRVHDALEQLGTPSTAREILDQIRQSYPDAVMANIAADLRLITVNDFSRGHHQGHERPRRTDTNHRYDLLFKTHMHDDDSVRFERYVPSLHEVWELYHDDTVTTKSTLRTKKITTGILAQFLKDAEQAAEMGGDFDFSNVLDMRLRVSQSIVLRRGQPGFRAALIEAYNGTCAVTGSTVQQVLEAAHISPFKGAHTHRLDNGLLLRADVHTLFDLGDIWIEGSIIRMAPDLIRSEYGVWEGRTLRTPAAGFPSPSADALHIHATASKQRSYGRQTGDPKDATT